ncbi:hypothetical protein [Pyrococcus kukulkanii]|uniref:Flagellin n=1 Tax=Pyrococcus kukulkanii TaxID=1609559 RepID=A0ABV4T074_9EURY
MRRGQISLELMFLMIVFMLILVYSLRLVTFTSSSSQDVIALQIGIEAKGFASAISNAISQVYAQGPGAKVTVNYRLTYLRDKEYLSKAFALNNPTIAISYLNGTYVMLLNGSGTILVNLRGPYKNVFWANSLYKEDILTNTSVFPDIIPNVNFDGNMVNLACIKIPPSNLPKIVKIVVEWDPDNSESWVYNVTSGELVIKINPR